MKPVASEHFSLMIELIVKNNKSFNLFLDPILSDVLAQFLYVYVILSSPKGKGYKRTLEVPFSNA